MKEFCPRRHTTALIAALLLLPMAMTAAIAANTTNFKSNVVVAGTFTASGATTLGAVTLGATTLSSATVTNNELVSGNLTVTGSTTLTTPLTAANIQTGSAKRELLRALTSPAGGAVTVNGTTYFANLAFGRAGVVKRISYMTHVDPVSGTNTIKVLKNGSAGNTMLSAASVSLNGSTADTAQNGTLTATGADLTLTATDSVYCEYTAGTQGSVAKDVSVVVEFEPTDF